MEIIAPIRRFIGWHRRFIATALAGLGTFVLITQLAPGVPDGVGVVVAVGTLSPGQTIGADDVAVRELPAAGVPDGAVTSPEEVIGQSLNSTVTANTVLQPGLLATADGAGPGRAHVPVRIPDDQLLELLVPGTRISLVAAAEAGAGVLVDDARVVMRPAPPAQAGFSATGSRPGLVILDVPAARAADVAVLGQHAELIVILD